jgi:hypothetical protein
MRIYFAPFDRALYFSPVSDLIPIFENLVSRPANDRGAGHRFFLSGKLVLLQIFVHCCPRSVLKKTDWHKGLCYWLSRGVDLYST